MQAYKTKISKLSGTDFHEVYYKAFSSYQKIKNKTKRRPYVRSVYFKKDKVFLELFWHHLHEKSNFRDKIRRMKYFPAAIEVIKNSRFDPDVIENPNNISEMLYRFTGTTKENDFFCVQIKVEKRSGKKWLMSVFPDKQKKTFR